MGRKWQWARNMIGRAAGGYALRTWQNGLFRWTLWWFTQLNKMPIVPHGALLAIFVQSDGMSTCAWMAIAGALTEAFKTSEAVTQEWSDSVVRTVTFDLDAKNKAVHFSTLQAVLVILLNIPVKLCGVKSSHVLRCVAMTLVLIQASMFGIQILISGKSALGKHMTSMEDKASHEGMDNVEVRSASDYALIPVLAVMIVLFTGSWRLAAKIYTVSLAALAKRNAVPRELSPEAMQRFDGGRGMFRFSLLKRYTVLRTLPRLYWTPVVLVSPIMTMCVAHAMLALMAIAYYVNQDNPNVSVVDGFDIALCGLVVVGLPWPLCAMLTSRPSHMMRKIGACLLVALTALSIVINVIIMIWRGVRLGHSAKLLLSDVFTYHLMCTLLTLTSVPPVIAGLRQAYKDAAENLTLTVPPHTWVMQYDVATDTAADQGAVAPAPAMPAHPAKDVMLSAEESTTRATRSSVDGPRGTDETHRAPTASDDDDEASTQRSDTKLIGTSA